MMTNLDCQYGETHNRISCPSFELQIEQEVRRKQSDARFPFQVLTKTGNF